MLLRPLAVLLAVLCLPDEGQWLPTQVREMDWEALHKRGMVLTKDQFWHPEQGGVLSATVQINGCTASFCSADGLLVTNHHCGFGAVSELSTPERNHLRDGFAAPDRAGELPAPGMVASVLKRIEDVTAVVHEAQQKAKDDLDRWSVTQRTIARLVAEGEAKETNTKCSVASFLEGKEYHLYYRTQIRDVRLVYAPPRAIGEFGGETDNWEWPRHTGDFTFFRAYVAPDGSVRDHQPDNVPYRPQHFLKVATAGVQQGDLAIIMGYPGRTQRYKTSASVAMQQGYVYPRRLAVLTAAIEALEQAGKSEPDHGARGRRSHQVARQRAEERGRDDVRPVAQRDGRAEAARGGAVHRLAAAGRRAPNPLGRGAAGDAGDRRRRTAGDRTRDADVVPRHARGRHAAVRCAGGSLRRRGLGARRQGAGPVAACARQRRPGPALGSAAAARCCTCCSARSPRCRPRSGCRAPGSSATARSARRRSRRSTRARCATPRRGANCSARARTRSARARIRWSCWPRALAQERLATLQRQRTRAGRCSTPAGVGSRRREAFRGKSFYPDANSTLRVSIAEVAGYSPREAVTYAPHTTVAGLLQKETGKEPFANPKALLEAAKTRSTSRWVDARLGDVPVCFLTNGDTTGGNSGSPVCNGKGELIGLNFDRVFENVVGDFAWNKDRSRNVVCDVRYILWVVESVLPSPSLLQELGA